MMHAIAFNSFQKVSQTIQDIYQLRMNGLHKFKPKVRIYGEIGSLCYKTIDSFPELKEALALRFQVFHKEMIGKNIESGLDIDEFDFTCDHLVIKDLRTQKVIGTYRLNCSLFNDDFYSAREFHLDRIMAIPGVKLELGRACIHKNYRKGAVISLLWRGIADYMNQVEAQVLFGCASVKTKSPREAALLYRYFFESGRMKPEFFAPPTISFIMPDLSAWIQSFQDMLTEDEKAQVEEILPALCRAYLKIGAYVGGEPAWDKDFQCIDFLTILRREDLNRSLWKKYKLSSEPSIVL